MQFSGAANDKRSATTTNNEWCFFRGNQNGWVHFSTQHRYHSLIHQTALSCWIEKVDPAGVKTKRQQTLAEIHDFLLCDTPEDWIDNALANQALLLIDHANCEKKAASTAINLLYRYVEFPDLLHKMSRLAREELRHFEQVVAIMQDRGIVYEQISAARYAGELRKLVRTHEPGKLIDTLIVGAIIEARSCERFARLAPVLDQDLKSFYQSLLKSEARHFHDYLRLAEQVGDGCISPRVNQFLEKEQQLIQAPDVEFRFHSGPLSQ